MNKLKFAFALLALTAGGQIMAWTRVLNYTSYPIKFRAALHGVGYLGDINADWEKSPVIPAIKGRTPGEFFTHEGLANLRFRYDIFADMGDGKFIPVLEDNVNNEAVIDSLVYIVPMMVSGISPLK